MGKEKLLMHGMPVYKVQGVNMECPFLAVLDKLTDEELGHVAGNGMAQCIVGPLMAYVLATTQVSGAGSQGLRKSFSADCGLGQGVSGEDASPTFEEALESGVSKSLRALAAQLGSSSEIVVGTMMDDDL